MTVANGFRSCGICCFGFSLFAICFLVVVGAVLKSGSDVISIAEDKRDNAVKNCNIGAAIYGGFVGLSLVCIFLPARVCPPKREEEQELIDQYRVR